MLHDAARKGYVKLFRKILQMGADIGSVGYDGRRVEDFIEEDYEE